MYLDIVFSVSLLLGFYYGFQKGIVRSTFSIASFIFGLFIASTQLDLGVALIKEWFVFNDAWYPIFAFLFLFVFVVFVIRLSAYLIEKFLQISLLNIFNRLIGGVAFTGVISVIMSLIVQVGLLLNLFTSNLINESILFGYIASVWPTIYANWPILRGQIPDIF